MKLLQQLVTRCEADLAVLMREQIGETAVALQAKRFMLRTQVSFYDPSSMLTHLETYADPPVAGN